MGLADIARHVMGCHSNQETRVQNAWDEWRATCARPYGLDVCRKMDSEQKNQCVKGEQRGYYPVGPLCASGCRATHEKCECWRIRRAAPKALEARVTLSAQARFLKDLEALTVARAMRAQGTPWGTGPGAQADAGRARRISFATS